MKWGEKVFTTLAIATLVITGCSKHANQGGGTLRGKGNTGGSCAVTDYDNYGQPYGFNRSFNMQNYGLGEFTVSAVSDGTFVLIRNSITPGLENFYVRVFFWNTCNGQNPHLLQDSSGGTTFLVSSLPTQLPINTRVDPNTYDSIVVELVVNPDGGPGTSNWYAAGCLHDGFGTCDLSPVE
jgi:hypothetical protein